MMKGAGIPVVLELFGAGNRAWTLQNIRKSKGFCLGGGHFDPSGAYGNSWTLIGFERFPPTPEELKSFLKGTRF